MGTSHSDFPKDLALEEGTFLEIRRVYLFIGQEAGFGVTSERYNFLDPAPDSPIIEIQEISYGNLYK